MGCAHGTASHDNLNVKSMAHQRIYARNGSEMAELYGWRLVKSCRFPDGGVGLGFTKKGDYIGWETSPDDESRYLVSACVGGKYLNLDDKSYSLMEIEDMLRNDRIRVRKAV